MNITIHDKQHNITLYNVTNVTFDNTLRKLTINCWITKQTEYVNETQYKEIRRAMQELNCSCTPGIVIIYAVQEFIISE